MKQLRRFTFLLNVSLVVIGCNADYNNSFPLVTAKTINDVVHVNAFNPKMANYIPLYIGEFKRSIDLKLGNKHDSSSTIIHGLNYINNLKSHQLEITIDMTQTIKSPISDAIRNKSGKIVPANALSYPVLLKNLSNEVIKIGWCNEIYLEMEVYLKDKWLSIESSGRFYNDACSSSLNLPKYQIALSTVPIYYGEIECPARLKLGQLFSNSFTTKINYEQILEKNKLLYNKVH